MRSRGLSAILPKTISEFEVSHMRVVVSDHHFITQSAPELSFARAMHLTLRRKP
jgi:hypothetical protein